MASHKLKHYFTALPIERGLLESGGHWVELAPFTLFFVARSTIKSQALADFIIDWTPATPAGGPPMMEPVWTASVDTAWGTSGAEASSILSSPSGQEV